MNTQLGAVSSDVCLYDRLNDGCFLHGQLQDVSVAAEQRALRCRPVLCFVLWSHRVDDEPGCQIEAFGQLRLSCPTSCTETRTQS